MDFQTETETLHYRQHAMIEMMIAAHSDEECIPKPSVIIEYLVMLREIDEEIDRRLNIKIAV